MVGAFARGGLGVVCLVGGEPGAGGVSGEDTGLDGGQGVVVCGDAGEGVVAEGLAEGGQAGGDGAMVVGHGDGGGRRRAPANVVENHQALSA